MNRITRHVPYTRPTNDNAANDNRLSFTPREDDIIRRDYPLHTAEEIGLRLERTPRAIYQRARLLEITKAPAISAGCKARIEAMKAAAANDPSCRTARGTSQQPREASACTEPVSRPQPGPSRDCERAPRNASRSQNAASAQPLPRDPLSQP